MENKGIYFRLKPGKQQEYKKRHDKIWPEMVSILKNAGIRNYSIWCYGEMLFANYEIDDSAKAQEVLNNSEVYIRWRDYMEDIIFIDADTGQKEWDMELLFYLP